MDDETVSLDKVTDGAVVLLSGGVDSTTLLHYVSKRLGVSKVHALTFIYGQKHVREIEMAKWQARVAGVVAHEVIDLSCFSDRLLRGSALTDDSIPIPRLEDINAEERDQPPTYVPHRNLMLLSLAAGYAECHGIGDIFYGAQAQDEYGYWDCTTAFVTCLNRTLALNRKRPVVVHAPFAELSKKEVVKIGLEMGVDYAHTWTCYRGEQKPCGTCPSCVEREKAFREAAE